MSAGQRLVDLRQQAAERCEAANIRVRELERALIDAHGEQADALSDLNYWAGVRETDEILRLCLVEGNEQSIVRGQDIVRDGVPIRVCMERVPCPVHGRRLGSSDWRLHRMDRPDVLGINGAGDAQLTGHMPKPCPEHPQFFVAETGVCPACAEKADEVALERLLPDLPVPTPNL